MCRMLKREIKSLFSNVKDIGNRILYMKGAPVNVYPTQVLQQQCGRTFIKPENRGRMTDK